MHRHLHHHPVLRSGLRRFAPALTIATCLTCLAYLTGAAGGLAWAGPRDDMKTAYDAALIQANNLEYDAALNLLNTAISTAEGSGHSDDPVLASLYMMRAALTFSAEGHAAAGKILGDLKKAVSLNYYVVVPMEMRSEDLANYMQQARQSSGATAPAPITMRNPESACDGPLHFEVLLSVPDGGQAALYWRKAGSGSEFVGAEMPAFSNVAEIDIPADQHGNANIEYFIYAFDASMNPAANLGMQDEPMVLEQRCKGDEPEPEPEPEVEAKPPVKLPRVWINLGVGTGFGLASGTAENTYRQFFPRGQQEYGAAEASCAIARWVAGDRPLTAVDGNTELLPAFDTFGAPGSTPALMAAYNPTACAERHPVSTGLALAPFHFAPEIAVRIGKRVSLGVYGRFQFVTGAKIFRDDPKKPLTQAFMEDVACDPAALDPVLGTPVQCAQGVKQKVPFTVAAGLKLKVFLGKENWKLRPFVGGFAGGGFARLRVNMGFANDRNGNSVPDDQEIGFDTNIQGECTPVWPYNNSCDANMTGTDNLKAANLAAASNSAEDRIDVVRIGPVFIGALVGFNYQIHKNFALFGELGLGGWFPNQGSFLIDLTVGPAISF